MELTKKERLLLFNQYRILQELDTQNADEYKIYQKALQYGYEIEYNNFARKFCDEMETSKCQEVIDILNMFRLLEMEYESLPDKNGIDEFGVKFRGFYGNTECSEIGYTRYLVEDCRGFPFLSTPTRDLDSHCPLLSEYKMMLERWKQSNDKYNLTKEDLVRICPAK